MKKINFTFLLAILLSMVGSSAFAYDAVVDGIYYDLHRNINSGFAEVTYYAYFTSYTSNANAYEGSIVIPESIVYDNVTYQVTAVTNYAFYGCKNMTSITIPNSITQIGNNAFQYCSGLSSIEIPNTITTIRGSVFEGCSGLTSISIPNSVTAIGAGAFRDCKGLSSIEIPNSVTAIGGRAFEGCSGLTSVTISNSVTTIGYEAFNGTPWYQQLPEGVVYIGSVAYSHKGDIGEDVIIKEGTITISADAFKDCKDMSTIQIPSSVNRIEDNAFENCKGLKKVVVSDIVAWCNIEYPSLSYSQSYNTANPLYYAGHLYSDENTEITGLEIPEGVKGIGPTAFINCSNISTVKIPSTIESIERYAFLGCSSLSSLTFPDNITSIGKGAFNDGTKLYVNKNSSTLPTMWSAGYKPYLIGTSDILEPPYLSVVSTTQTTATFKLENKYEEFNYLYSIPNQGYVPFIGDEVTLTGLFPNSQENFRAYITQDNPEQTLCSISVTYVTQPISPIININATASSIHVTASYTEGDAEVVSQRLVLNPRSVYSSSGNIYGGTDLEELVFDSTGLEPNTIAASFAYTIVVKNGKQTKNYTTQKINAKTEILQLTTQQPKVVSLGNVIVSAEANIDDEEKNVGFEWRRTDWTDDFQSNTGTANMVEGTMEGFIRNLNTEKLWKYRPYYLADNGTYYYGDWVGIDPTNVSYFEPTVHTYAKIAISGNTALVKGYALSGSDDVTVQGFKYWKKASANNRAASDIPSDAMTIEAKGTVMEVSLTDLEYASSYEYVAFATTSEGDTFYGEIKTFETGESPVTPGDANGDGVVNVTDIVEIVNDILGHPSAKFDKTAADVNGDGVVNVTDIVSVVNIILSSNARELTNRAAATNNLKLSGGSIKLRNAENYTAAQFDIHLTDGSTVNYLSLNSTSDHQMTWQMVDANTCRVIVYSLSNSPFRAVKDELFNVTLSGNATISNELLVNVDSMVTGINEMQFDKPVNVYDLRGNKVRSNTTDLNDLQKGVYIVNGKKVVVK